MYGLINNALEDMIVTHFGDETWQKIHRASGVEEDAYLTMHSYADESTYLLAGSASEVLETPLDDCLVMFGHHWVSAIATKNFASLMEATGSDTVSFLHNLNGLHDRISTTFLDYIPPEFRVQDVDVDAGLYHVHYHSERKGLTPFVTGLLEGLAKHFGDALEILSIKTDETGEGAHTVYELTIK